MTESLLVVDTRLPARLVSLATAVPIHVLRQDDVIVAAEQILGAGFADFKRLAPVYRNACIDQRYACMPIDWFYRPHDFTERNSLYIKHAVDLLVEAAAKAIASAGLTADQIDGVMTVSTSGIATPSLDALVIERMRLRRDVQRLPIFGLGCAGGVIGLARAAQIAMAEPDKIYLFLVVELCSLNFLHGDRSSSNIVATALFGDGAAAAVVSCQGAGPILRAWAEHSWPNSLDVMGWDVGNDGLKVIFSRDIPSLARRDLRPVIDRFLGSRALGLADIDRFVCHPGGAKVLDALEQALDMSPGDLVASRAILRRYGNMSAATVLFVLRQVLMEEPSWQGRALLTTFGPGFTAGLLLLERA